MSNISPILIKRVLSNFPYILFFWFSAKLGEAYRLAPGDNLQQRLTGFMGTLNTALSNPLPSFHPQDLLVGLIGAATIYFIVWYKKKNAKKYRKNAEYGSACWGNKKDILPFLDSNPENNIILTQTEGLTMNSRPANPAYARNKNMLVIGGSGSGRYISLSIIL